MKSNGSHVMIVGILLWGSLAALIAASLWSLLGVWPSNPKGWLFVLILCPIVWLLVEIFSDVVIDLIDYVLPTVRHVPRLRDDALSDHARKDDMAMFVTVSTFVGYAARVAIVLGVVYLLLAWIEDSVALPYRYDAVQGLRYWWHDNFAQ